jgi:hypothetical protein
VRLQPLGHLTSYPQIDGPTLDLSEG